MITPSNEHSANAESNRLLPTIQVIAKIDPVKSFSTVVLKAEVQE